jgi:hypothetical protein
MGADRGQVLSFSCLERFDASCLGWLSEVFTLHPASARLGTQTAITEGNQMLV